MATAVATGTRSEEATGSTGEVAVQAWTAETEGTEATVVTAATVVRAAEGRLTRNPSSASSEGMRASPVLVTLNFCAARSDC